MISRIVSLILSVAFVVPCYADWTLNNDTSFIQFISTKNQHIAEIHSFKSLTGSIDKQGKLEVKINLASVDTLIPIRDQRLRESLFETSKYPTATFSADLPTQINQMQAGTTLDLVVAGQLQIKQSKQAMDIKVRVTKLSNHNIQASTLKPVLVQAALFELDSGIEKLRQLAGLSSISLVVPVNFNVTFQSTK